MPENRDISGFVMSRVSMVSRGLSSISTTVDADWRGKLLLAVTNLSNAEICLNHAEPICALVLFENKTPITGASEKYSNRSDILKKIFSDRLEALKARRYKEYLASFFAFAMFAGVGYAIFGNSEGFSAMVAVGSFAAFNLQKYISS